MAINTKTRIIFVLFCALFATGFALALDYRPATIKSMDVTITSEASGFFSGSVSRGDEMELMVLSIKKTNEQEVISLEEYLEIGGKKILPEKIEKNGQQYARYKIPDLYEFAGTPEFRVVRKARLRKTANIGIGEDYDLSKPLNGFDDFLKQTPYMEVNDQELRGKAELEFRSDSEIETIRDVAEWVNNNIEYDFEKYYNGVYSAKETYYNKAGVCDEFANLTGAFLRVSGVPVRYVSGISFDGERFGNHGWLEVYLPGTGWIGVDSTYGEAGYLDAGHFTITTARDANDIIDFASTVTSRKPLEVEASLELPKIEVNSVEFFQSLLTAEIEKPGEVHGGETFTVRAKIKNISGKHAILPVELVVHKNFKQEKRQKLVYLKKGEEKTLEWGITAPAQGPEGGYVNYGMVMLLPDGNITDWVKMVPGTKDEAGKASIVVKDVSPHIKAGELDINVTLENRSGKSGSATITVAYNNEEVSNQEISLEGFSERAFQQKIINFEPGKAVVIVKTDTEKTYEIIIPEKIVEEKIEAKEVSSAPTQSITRPPEKTEQIVAPPINTDALILGIGAIVAAAIIIGLLVPRLTKGH